MELLKLLVGLRNFYHTLRGMNFVFDEGSKGHVLPLSLVEVLSLLSFLFLEVLALLEESIVPLSSLRTGFASVGRVEHHIENLSVVLALLVLTDLDVLGEGSADFCRGHLNSGVNLDRFLVDGRLESEVLLVLPNFLFLLFLITELTHVVKSEEARVNFFENFNDFRLNVFLGHKHRALRAKSVEEGGSLVEVMNLVDFLTLVEVGVEQEL